jgi:hypothetical protein
VTLDMDKFALAIRALPNPHGPLTERDKQAWAAFKNGDDAEVLRLMNIPERTLSLEDRAFLIVHRWFDENQADKQWWKRIGLWAKRDDLVKAIVKEFKS